MVPFFASFLGYFLDYLGRYDLLYLTIAICVLFTAFLWLFEPLINTKKVTRS